MIFEEKIKTNLVNIVFYQNPTVFYNTECEITLVLAKTTTDK